MCSQLIEDSEIEAELVCATASQAELEDLGYKGFVIRLFALPTTGLGVRFTLMIYPARKADLEADQPLHEKPAFSGIKVGAFENIQCGFEAATIIDKCVGSPILPCIMVKEPIRAASIIPSRDDFLEKISATMRNTVQPEVKQNGRTLAASWANLKEKGESHLYKEPAPMEWPEYVRAELLPHGKIYFIN